MLVYKDIYLTFVFCCVKIYTSKVEKVSTRVKTHIQHQHSKIMKTLIFLLAIVLFLPSCTVRQIGPDGQVRSVQHYGPGAPRLASSGHHSDRQVQTGINRKLESVDVTRSQTGHCVASVQNGHESRIQEVAEYAAANMTIDKDGRKRLPSDESVSQRFGFKCIVKWIDTPDKAVKTVRVRPSDVPPEILARF